MLPVLTDGRFKVTMPSGLLMGKNWSCLVVTVLEAHIYITDNEGQNPRRLTENKGSHHVDPSWSPDGQLIAYTGCPPKKCSQADLEVFVIPASGARSGETAYQ
ncbi:MAG: hypothetical protein WKG07_39955 [Hymenobacter sp.]